MEKVKERTGIYHEHQQGALCAQHALNNLLQTQMFSADTLADIARELDAEEKSVLTHSLQQSENMDDTGFFNIQVLQRALKIFEIELVPFSSQELIAKQARSSPESIQAYICNLGLHWFTIRRFDRQYFNLNSFYYVPEFIPHQDLSTYLNFVEENGYSVFIVNGQLTPCLADQQLRINPIGRAEYTLLTKDLPKLIMDDKVIGSSKDSIRNGKLVVQVSPDLYNEFKKNPNNPLVREKILAGLPKGVLEEDLSEHTGCSNPNHHHHHRPQQILVARMPERKTAEKSMEGHYCSNCQGYHDDQPVISDPFNDQLFDDMNMDQPNESHHGPKMITRHVTQVTIRRPQPDNPNSLSQQRNVSRTLLIVTESSHGNSLLTSEQQTEKINRLRQEIQKRDDLYLQHTEKMNRLRQEIQKKEDLYLQYTMAQSSPENNSLVSQQDIQKINRLEQEIQELNSLEQEFQKLNRLRQQIQNDDLILKQSMAKSSPGNSSLDIEKNIQEINRLKQIIQSEEDLILQHAMAQSLLGESAMDDNLNVPFLEDQSEQIYQQMLDKVIAASLQTSNSVAEKIEQTPELIPITNINSSPPPTTTNSESITNMNSSLTTTTNSESITNMNSSLTTTTNSESITNMNSSLTTTTNSESITNMNSSLTTTTNSEPITIKMPSSLSTLPSLTNTHSSSLKNTDSLSLNVPLSTPPNTPVSTSANASFLPVMNTSLTPSINTSVPPSITTNPSLSVVTNSPPPPPTTTTTNLLPPMTTKSSPPPTLTTQNSVESPTVEELRLRRLQGYGNRDRSIISAQSNFDD